MIDLYSTILNKKKKGVKLFAVLIDPDKFNSEELVKLCEDSNVDLIMVGGSIITKGDFEGCIKTIKGLTNIPVIIFPGNYLQVSDQADAILLLSLISGRNADMLIGNHVIAAATIRRGSNERFGGSYACRWNSGSRVYRRNEHGVSETGRLWYRRPS